LKPVQRTLIRWFVLTVAVWGAAVVVPGIEYDRWESLLIAALALGILNTFVKPVLQILSLPFIVLTFGLFLLLINAVLLRFTAWLVAGFHVPGLWPAVGGSLVISIVSMFLGCSGPTRRRFAGRTETMFSTPRRPPGRGPALDA
jgi:putative membrane protein